MSRAEKFIEENTKVLKESNGKEYFNWLTPDDARKAIEIEKEEMMEQTLSFLKDRLYKTGYVGIIDLCDEYIKAMKDE